MEEGKPFKRNRRRAKLSNVAVVREKREAREIAKQVLGQYNTSELPKLLRSPLERRKRIFSMYISGAEVPVIARTLKCAQMTVRNAVRELEKEVAAMERVHAAHLVFSVFQSTMDNYRNNQVELLVQRNALEQHRGRCQEYIIDLAKGENVPDGTPQGMTQGFTADTVPILNEAEAKAAQREHTAREERKARLRATVQGLHEEIATCNRGILDIMTNQRLNDKESWAILSQMGVPDMPPAIDDGSHTSPENSLISADSVPLLPSGEVDLDAVKDDERASLERRLAALKGDSDA